MDKNSRCGKSVSKGKKSAAIRDSDSVDKLSSSFSGKVKIKDEPKFPAEGYHIVDEEEDDDEEEEEDGFSEEDLLAQMGYGKSEPETDIKKGPQIQYCDEDEEDEEEEEEEEDGLSEESFLAQMGYLKNEPPIHEPITTPTANLNLVSAFKGSREKKEKPARVSWAPDVYDPPPTSDDHFTTSKTERHKSEHKVKGVAGKNRQKTGGKREVASDDVGGGGKGGGSKAKFKDKKSVDKKPVDKKQAKKCGRSASKYSGFNED